MYISLFIHLSLCPSLCVQAEWVALNYVPFAERSLEVVVDLYHKTACHKAVINEKVLQSIIKVFFTCTLLHHHRSQSKGCSDQNPSYKTPHYTLNVSQNSFN